MKCICDAYLESRKKHFEPPHDKTNKMTFVPSKDSDQPGQPDRANSDQTGQMPRLICVFTGRTNHFVGFVMPWLNFHIETTSETIAYSIVTTLHMHN